MKHVFLLILLLLFIVKNVGTEKPYHGNRRHWTFVNSAGETYIALNLVNQKIKLLFPQTRKTFADIASDIKLYSVTNDQCKTDTRKTLGFTLGLAEQKWIRGSIMSNNAGGGVATKVLCLLFEKCGREENTIHYSSNIIDQTYASLESNGRMCFTTGDPFLFYDKDNTKKEMELQVTGSFKCLTYLVLPFYMEVEDSLLPPEDVQIPLNESFAGHDDGFWWKDVNDPLLPEGISFAQKNVQIDILKTTKANPIFLRLGANQTIPTLEFEFDGSCTDHKFQLYLNLREKEGDVDCGILIHLVPGGYEVTTKNGIVTKVEDRRKSPVFVFEEHGHKVYLKAASIFSITPLEVCTIDNAADVPADQIVLQVFAAENACPRAQVTLLAGDVISNTIEVLIDRAKTANLTNPDILNGTNVENSTDAIIAATTSSSATASIEWWWFVAAGGGLLVVIVIGILVYFFCIRRRQTKTKKKAGRPIRKWTTLDDDEGDAISARTAIPKTEPQINPTNNKKQETEPQINPTNNMIKEKSKEKKKEKNVGAKGKESKKKKDKTKKKEYKVEELEESKRSEKAAEGSKGSEKEGGPYGQFPLKQKQQSKTRTTQEDPTIQTGSTQNASLQTQPGNGTIEKVAAAAKKPSRPKLMHRTMYGPAGFVNMNDPYDYHQNEAESFEPTINFAAIKAGTSPPLLQFENFWNCIDKISIPKRYAPVYVNSKIPGSSVFFIVRDCVADEAIYAPFRSFSNRILEPMKHELARSKSEHSTVDGEKKLYVLRVFVLSYEPLTLEIHCRGQCPQFLFNLLECDECIEIGNRLQRNAWINSKATCRDNWDIFLCRVKRTPINSHQFYSYNGPTKPQNSDEVNHVLVIRGNKKPNKLRECLRGCSFPDASHPNNITLETELQGDPTLQTQNTQQSN